MQPLTITITQQLAQPITPPLLHLTLPELGALTDLLQATKLLIVPRYRNELPYVAGKA